jgi:hypothetical protein
MVGNLNLILCKSFFVMLTWDLSKNFALHVSSSSIFFDKSPFKAVGVIGCPVEFVGVTGTGEVCSPCVGVWATLAMNVSPVGVTATKVGTAGAG